MSVVAAGAEAVGLLTANGSFPDNSSGMLSGITWHWDNDFEAIVHPYWRQFPLVPEAYHYLVGIYISIVGIISILGNILVLYIFASTKTLRTPPNMFIMNLAISDLTFSAVNGFPLLTISSFNTRWAWGPVTCVVYGFIGGMFGFISINTLAMIALDRYCVIVQPFQNLKSMTTRRAMIMIVLVWIWSILWSCPPFFGFGSYVPEGFQTSCTFDYLTQTKGNILFNVGMYVFGFSVPVGTIVFCYYQIVKAVRLHELEMIKMAQKLSGNNKATMKTGGEKSDVKAAKMSLFIICLFLLSWTPYAIIALMALVGRRDHLTPYTAELPVLFAKTSAVYNPIVYAISHPRFRATLEKKFPWVICCCPPKAKERELASGSMASKGNLGRANSERDSTVSSVDMDNTVAKEEEPNKDATEMKKMPPNATGGGQQNVAYQEDRAVSKVL